MPALMPYSIVIMESMSNDKGPYVGQSDDRPADFKILHFPPYAPDFGPIDRAIAKLDAMLRKAVAWTAEAQRMAMRLPQFRGVFDTQYSYIHVMKTFIVASYALADR